MKRYSLFLLFLAASPTAAQDIALSQILSEGQDWRLVSKDNKSEWEFAETLRKAAHPTVDAANGFHYYIDEDTRTVVSTRQEKKILHMDHHRVDGTKNPAGITLWPDGRTLVIGDAEGKHLWSYRVEKNGSLTCGDRYYALRVKPGQTASGVTALTVDARGLLYACTPLGVQIFDPTGRMCGVLLPAAAANPTAIAFGGPDRDLLYVQHGEAVYVRKTQAKGVAPVEKKQ